MTTTEKLNKLYELKSQLQLRKLDMEALIKSIIPDEVKVQIKEIEEEFSFVTSHITDELNSLEAEIKQEVSLAGETVRGDYIMAVWSKPRTTWDNKGLDGYAVAHPEIVQFRRTGEPSVSIRSKE